MTISSEISKLQTNLSNAYSAAESKGATLPASQNFDNLSTTINSINVETITVDQTYDATSTNAQSGTAVAEAVSSKQDTLVSGTNIKTINGNSLLGSSDIAIETNTDDETISYNSSDALQVIAVKNKRDDSTLPIWHGTEYQWNHGVPITWYYWQTSVTAMWTNGGSLPSSKWWPGAAYGDGAFVTVATNQAAYSTDGGQTWNSTTLSKNKSWYRPIYGGGTFVAIVNCSSSEGYESIYSTDGGQTWDTSELYGYFYWQPPVYGNGIFLAVAGNMSNRTTYSTDGGKTWVRGGDLPSNDYWQTPAYGDGIFVTVAGGPNQNSSSVAYSTDGGQTWSSAILPESGSWLTPTYGNGVFVAVQYYSTKTAYSTDGGQTWQSGGNLGSYAYRKGVVYGSGSFVTIGNSLTAYYSTDNGITWNSSTLPSSASWQIPTYGDGIFVVVGGGADASNEGAYSTDGGATWISSGLSSAAWTTPTYGNGKFIVVGNRGSDASAIFSVNYDKCYTDTANPTTTSVVYSAPETVASYTISSVTSGAITLSNNNTYYYNQSGNAFTYRTIGDAHPEYLAFIDGVGVKMGNNWIASATPITTSITSTSTDAEA